MNGLLGVQTQAATTCTLGLLCNTVTSGFVRDAQGTLVAEKIGSDEYYYAFDGLGSVVALIDATGTQRASYSYDPYGGHATATALNGALPDNPWRYAGGALDSTGLYHFGARYYDPAIGRWTQEDSVLSLGDHGNGNRYAYVGDDPVNFADGTGLREKSASSIPGDVITGCAQGAAQNAAFAAGTAAVTGGQIEVSAGELGISCVAEGAAKGFEDVGAEAFGKAFSAGSTRMSRTLLEFGDGPTSVYATFSFSHGGVTAAPT